MPGTALNLYIYKGREDSQVRKIPWRRAWLPTPVFSPGESHGQRSLVGYSPKGRKESDTAEPTEHACIYMCVCVCIYICIIYILIYILI